MISFRFHVVSITAVFLAIAIGVVVGTTYVDGAIVDGLRNRIDSVEENLEERRAENDQLEGQLERAGAYTDASDDYAVTDRLTGVPVLLVATRGIDEGVVEQTALLARQAGAITPGIVWLEAAWSLEGEDERSALADLVGESADDPVEDLWAATWDAIIVELTEGDSSEVGLTTTTLDEEAATPLLLALEAGGFISIDAIDDESPTLEDLVGTAPRMLAVTGARAQESVSTMVPAVINAAVDGGLSVVVADVYVEAPEAPGRGDLLEEALPEALRDVIVLVDHADRADGRVAAVLGLDWVAEGTGNAGHFGYGAGADGVLPPWTAP